MMKVQNYNQNYQNYYRHLLINYRTKMGTTMTEIQRLSQDSNRNYQSFISFMNIFLELAKDKKKRFQDEVFQRSSQHFEIPCNKIIVHKSQIQFHITPYKDWRYYGMKFIEVMDKYLKGDYIQEMAQIIASVIFELVQNVGQTNQKSGFFIFLSEIGALLRVDYLFYVFTFESELKFFCKNILLIDYIITTVDTSKLGPTHARSIVEMNYPYLQRAEKQRLEQKILEKQIENQIENQIDKINVVYTTQVLIKQILKMILNVQIL